MTRLGHILDTCRNQSGTMEEHAQGAFGKHIGPVQEMFRKRPSNDLDTYGTANNVLGNLSAWDLHTTLRARFTQL